MTTEPTVPAAFGIDFDRIRRIRAEDPGAIGALFRERRRRPFVGGDGRLLIIAADHPARGVFSTGTQIEVLSDRLEMLRRLAIALSRPGVDGVLGTADILEDLLVAGLLEKRIAIGAVNRAGLANSVFEVDDRVSGYDVDHLVRSRLDAGKLLLRICLTDDHMPAMLERAARIVDAAADARLPMFIEPFMADWIDGRLRHDLTATAMAHAVGIAGALGGSSAYTWLKLPVVPEMERVMNATTLPVLLLGGDSPSDPQKTYAAWSDALRLPGVRGLVVGRSLLYPADGDVAAAVDIAASLVRGDQPQVDRFDLPNLSQSTEERT